MQQMMTVKQAAQQLAVAQVTLRAWIGQRKLGYVRLGRAVRIPVTEIERMIEASTIPSKKD